MIIKALSALQSLLSEKYGFRPIPARIPKDEFRSLSSVISSESDFELLFSWYHLDENHKPPVYVLQPISSRIHDFINLTDDSARKAAVDEWMETMSKISKILRSSASLVLFGNEKRKYFASSELDQTCCLLTYFCLAEHLLLKDQDTYL